MSKRASESITMAGGKKTLTAVEQVVLLKREFHKGVARIENNVIYKLDCKSLNEKTQSLVCVESKKMFDEIETDCSYKFVLERRDNRRFYLLSYEKMDNVVITLKPDLVAEDFENELETLANVYVQGAYQHNDIIKVFGLIEFDGDYKQIDMYIRLNGSSCFKFDPETSRDERIDTVMSKCYKELLNKWWVFHVTCSRFRQYHKLVVRDNTSIQESDNTYTPADDCFENISYGPNKTFVLEEIKAVCKCEYVKTNNPMKSNSGADTKASSKCDDRISFELKTARDRIMYATKFGVSQDVAEETVSDVGSANYSLSLGGKLYCVYTKKVDDNQSFTNIVSMVIDDEEKTSTLMAA
ncbi:ORF113 LEF-3 [Cydia pomonella granulovirus]|uniref:ORF113 LEF-3 n=2 Tax=Cydia pomonella granulosis virus TaxID=28289 RepID=Q91EU2_GVCPM|nr:ORF113 LEF-3 [Cydia pomonella granulovirus]AAK70773.1 ORF113 LEF-3 [Cydia pomonella granulovirus]AIU36760.1 ORF113 lef-3 [Cydia pomonella granulovirus]AIU36896.1 ORF113 lef-3 [Cydia pomonella granulovirus]AIU37039.1 ORF113 lef-3 [Cydia pomonella granulovirus]AIU37181.1 ORF113 lef-3 [Cydia pomonella granulovirus]